MEPDERANRGLFLAFQYPVEIPGVAGMTFLREAYNAKLRHAGREEATRWPSSSWSAPAPARSAWTTTC